MIDTQKEVTLGGRIFVTSPTDEMPFDQYAWMARAAEEAGLGIELMKRVEPAVLRAVETETPLTEEEAKTLVTGIVTRCYKERAHLEVLAGILVEKGQEWTYESAVETKTFLGRVKGQDEIAAINELLGMAIIGFFWGGLDSMRTSPKSSAMGVVMQKIAEVESEQPEGLVTSES